MVVKRTVHVHKLMVNACAHTHMLIYEPFHKPQ